MTKDELADALELLAEIVEAEARGIMTLSLMERAARFTVGHVAHEAVAAMEAG